MQVSHETNNKKIFLYKCHTYRQEDPCEHIPRLWMQDTGKVLGHIFVNPKMCKNRTRAPSKPDFKWRMKSK